MKNFWILGLAVLLMFPGSLLAESCGGCGTSADAGCGGCGGSEPPVHKGAAANPAPTDAKKPAASVATLNSAALDAMVKAKTPLTILDARAGKNDDGKRIPGAKSLNEASTPDEIKTVLPDKEALVVTYCAGEKCSASPKLAGKLRELGYTNVMELTEGIAGWEKAGNKLETASKK